METKFTPGPWSICYDGQLDGADGTRVLFLPFDSYKEFNDLPPTFKANIRLIAAAPELLAALIEARAQVADICLSYRIPFPEASMVRYDDAIDKATGA